MRPKNNPVKDLADPAITPAALTVAGYDPSSGAGVTADLEVFASHGVAGVSAVTALTLQSKSGVRRVETVNHRFLQETLDLLAEEVTIDAMKIGMLATAELVRVVTNFLKRAAIPRERIVLDPVIRSSSGAELLSAEGVELVRTEMLGLVGWVTPNLAEAGALLGEGLPGRAEVPGVAGRIHALGTRAGVQGTGHLVPGAATGLNVVVTGGHLDSPDDFLRTAEGEEVWFPGERVEARGRHGTHGTGCVFSSALLCRLMLGDLKMDAVRGAKAAVVRRLLGDPVAGNR